MSIKAVIYLFFLAAKLSKENSKMNVGIIIKFSFIVMQGREKVTLIFFYLHLCHGYKISIKLIKKFVFCIMILRILANVNKYDNKECT